MRHNLSLVLVIAFFFALVANSEARNTLSSRPSEQQQNLPEFAPKAGSQPFVLPPVQSLTPDKTKNTGLKVTFRQIIFTGNSVFDNVTLENIAAPFLNKAIDVGDLEELRFRVTQFYVKNGPD